MAYIDGGTFTTYCDKPYTRHSYKLNTIDGESVIIEDYEVLRATWYHYKNDVESVEVLDITRGKGF
jgi:hypothetical protein